ncbi:unnamed protein product [Natator depressus]
MQPGCLSFPVCAVGRPVRCSSSSHIFQPWQWLYHVSQTRRAPILIHVCVFSVLQELEAFILVTHRRPNPLLRTGLGPVGPRRDSPGPSHPCTIATTELLCESGLPTSFKCGHQNWPQDSSSRHTSAQYKITSPVPLKIPLFIQPMVTESFWPQHHIGSS